MMNDALTIIGVGFAAIVVVASLLLKIDASVNKMLGKSHSKLDVIDLRLQELTKDVERLERTTRKSNSH